ncbi:MAG: CBM96 family carbohydrate-binding protein [Planctomycetota bacterium]
MKTLTLSHKKFLPILSIVILSLLPSVTFASGHVYVADFYDANELMTKSQLETLISFQGAVNADETRLYVRRYEEDIYWLENLESDYGITYTMLDSPWDAFAEPNLTVYCSEYILYDLMDCGLAQNNAVSLAGIVGGCCIVDNNSVDLNKMVNEYGFTLHSHADADMRGYWNTNEQAQLWGYNNLRNDCNNLIYGISEGTIESRNKGIDYDIQNNLFVWCIDSYGVHLSDYSTTQRAILDSYEPNTIAYGFWSKEVKDIEAMSEYGHTEAGHGPNGSVFSRLPQTGNLQQNAPSGLVEYDENKTYIFLSFSQGDALHFCLKDNYHHLTMVSQTNPSLLVRERYPFGLMHSTIQYDLQPNVPKLLYTMADTKQFFSGKGYGYANATTLENNGHLDGYLVKSREYMDKMGIQDFMLNDNNTETDPSHLVVKKICEELQPRSIIFKHQLNVGTDEDDAPEVFYGVPVFGDPVFCRRDEENNFLLNDSYNAVLASAAKRQFFWVFFQHTLTALELEALADKLTAEAPDIVILHPDEFIELYLDHMSPPPPPSVTLTDDAFVKQEEPSNNFGTHAALRMRGPDSNREIISYLKFDVFEPNSIISATLRLRAEDKDLEDATVHEVSDTSWSEDTLIWTNKPSIGAALDSVYNISSGTWAEFDVTSHITASGIYTLALKTTKDAATRDWYSKEGGNSPELILETTSTPTPPEKAANPSPAHQQTDVSINADLSWTAGERADSHDVYFGITSPGDFQGNQTDTTFDPGTLNNDTTYYWRIDEVNTAGTTTGDVWSFTTIVEPPGQASNPSPADSTTDISIDADLSWTAGSGATSHDVYFGTDSTPDSGEFQSNQTATTYDPGTMNNDTTYYWRIDEVNAGGTTTGAVWSFTTIAAPPGQATNPDPPDSATNVSINADLSWIAGSGATSHDVYFGTTSPGTSQGNQAATTFDPGTMSNDTTYYWRIDEVNAAGTTTGLVWSFTTEAAPQPPGQATNPTPADSATDVGVNADLSWTAGSGATSHDVYFGTSSPGTFQGNQAATTFDPGTMSNDTTYYWRIDEVNGSGTTTGAVWSFTTESVPLALPWSDDFETGDFSKGWTTQGSASVSTKAEYEGIYGAKLPDTALIEKAIDTTGFTNIHVKYYRKTYAFDSGEYLYVEYHDGSQWNELEVAQTNDWGSQQDKLCGAGADNNSNFKIRFRTNADKNNECAYVDLVEVTGTAQ